MSCLVSSRLISSRLVLSFLVSSCLVFGLKDKVGVFSDDDVYACYNFSSTPLHSTPLHSTPLSSSRRDQIKVAIEYLTSPELAAKEVQIIVETQLLLTPYLHGREKMHLLSVTLCPPTPPTSSTVQLVALDNTILLAVLVISLAVLHSIILAILLHPPLSPCSPRSYWFVSVLMVHLRALILNPKP